MVLVIMFEQIMSQSVDVGGDDSGRGGGVLLPFSFINSVSTADGDKGFDKRIISVADDTVVRSSFNQRCSKHSVAVILSL